MPPITPKTRFGPTYRQADDRMNGMEAMMWRAGARSRLRPTIVLVSFLDRVPDWDRFTAAHEWASRMVPRLRQHVVDPPLGVGTPMWATDPTFDLDYHLRRVRLAGDGTLRDLLDLAQALEMAPFDTERPLWEAVLVEGFRHDQAGYVVKLHHSNADATRCAHALSVLLSRGREPRSDKPQPPPPPPPESGGKTVLYARQMARQARSRPREAVRQAKEVTQYLLRRRLRCMPDAAEFVRSFGRVTAPAQAAPSPLLRNRSLSRRFDVLDLPMKDLRQAAAAADGTLNDAFLAGLLGAFGKYHVSLGTPVDALPMSIPVGLRTPGAALAGNQFAAVRFAAPIAEQDPRRRIHLVHDIVRRYKSEAAVNAVGVLAEGASRLPTPLASLIAARVTEANDLQASSVVGTTEPIYIAGAEITRMYGFGPLPGCTAMAAMISHNDICCMGINFDPAAITEPGLFAACLREGFQEVLDLAPGTHKKASP